MWLLQLLDEEQIPWLLLDPAGQVQAQGHLVLDLQGMPPQFEEAAWPPDSTTPPPWPRTDTLGRLWHIWPWPEGGYLVVWHAYWPQQVAQERAQRPKFISVVTHELRLPLTSIKGYADLLAKGIVGPINEQQQQFLEVIRNNVNRMAVLLDRLSEKGKLESGRLKLRQEVVDVTALLTRAAAAYLPLCREKGQTLEVQAEAPLPPALGDPDRVYQILTTLLDNAYRYTPEGGHIALGAAAQDREIRIWVEDNGIGIPLEEQGRLFEAFFRSEDQRVRDQPGWGLALHVAWLLAQRMGGRLEAQSRPEEGSRFTLVLPVAETQPDGG